MIPSPNAVGPPTGRKSPAAPACVILGNCPDCGKLRHLSRKAAKKFQQAHEWGHRRVHQNIYRCPVDDKFFHIGRLRPAVSNGSMTREKAYPRDRGGTMTTTSTLIYSSDTPEPGKKKTPAGTTPVIDLPEPPQADATPPAPRFADVTTVQLDMLFADLNTYRYHQQVPVTPAMALRMIELNAENNRNYQPKRGGDYARDIEAGHWREKTGQTIKIATDGRIIDGNHRMHAVAESGCVVVFDLCFGIDPGDILVVDAHRPRSRADQVRVVGGVDVTRTAPIIVRTMAWGRGAYMGGNASTSPTPIEIAEAYHAEEGLFDAAAKRGFDCQRRNLGNSAIIGTAYMLFARIDKEACERFFDLLLSGLFGPDGATHPVYHLREKLIRRGRLKLTPAEQLAAIIRTWNNHHTVKRGVRIPVHHLQITRRAPGAEESLTNANFPQPRKAVWLPGEQ